MSDNGGQGEAELTHVRWRVSASRQFKPQKPSSSCLKECDTVILCLMWRVCNGGQMGTVCHMTFLADLTLVLSDNLCGGL